MGQADMNNPHMNMYQDRHRPSSGGSDPSNSPTSRNDTPALHQSSNIAPQHMFDGVALSEHVFQSPDMRHPSPGHPRTSEELSHDNTRLRTRVSELEVINDLYRGTLAQYQIGGAPQAEMVPRATDAELREALERSQQRERELMQKVDELQHEIADLKDEQPPSKKARSSNDAENDPQYPEPPETFTNGLHS